VKGLRTEHEQRRLDFAVERLKFIDETSMNLALTRLYSRAAPGVRVVDRLPRNYGANLSLLAALDLAGLSAPMTVEGAVDAAVFRTYVEQVLGPTLMIFDKQVRQSQGIDDGGQSCRTATILLVLIIKIHKPGDIVMWDNLAVHQVAGIAEAIAARGARLAPLPPYSHRR
jgi:hypothetical protein